VGISAWSLAGSRLGGDTVCILSVANRLSQAERLSRPFPLHASHFAHCCTLPLGPGKVIIHEQIQAVHEAFGSQAVQSSIQSSVHAIPVDHVLDLLDVQIQRKRKCREAFRRAETQMCAILIYMCRWLSFNIITHPNNCTRLPVLPFYPYAHVPSTMQTKQQKCCFLILGPLLSHMLCVLVRQLPKTLETPY